MTLEEKLKVAVINEIDILEGAPKTFISKVNELEALTDYKVRSELAKQYIIKYKGITAIDYKKLGYCLNNYNKVPKTFWRQLYLLERSIIPRFGDKYTWLQRLKIFYNTYLEESAAIGSSWNGHKILWIKGNKDNPTNHDMLVMGNGQFKPDFYYYDPNVNKGSSHTTDHMVYIEQKFCLDSPEAGAAKYNKDKTYLYGAKLVMLYVASEKKYYMVDYNKVPYSITELSIKAPKGLLVI